MAEILTLAALEQSKSVAIDGTLQDVTWYTQYIQVRGCPYRMRTRSILDIYNIYVYNMTLLGAPEVHQNNSRPFIQKSSPQTRIF